MGRFMYAIAKRLVRTKAIVFYLGMGVFFHSFRTIIFRAIINFLFMGVKYGKSY